jgi:hypothetical protein
MPKKKQAENQNQSKNREFVAEVLGDGDNRAFLESLGCEIFEFDGEFAFRYYFADKPGIVGLEYISIGLAEWAISEAKAIIRGTTAQAIAGQPGEDEYLKSEAFLKEIPTDAGVMVVAKWTALRFLLGLPGKLRSLLGELALETSCYIQEVTLKHLTNGRDSRTTRSSIEQLAKEMAAERKHFLKESVARAGAPKWGDMKHHYDALLPQAKDIKEVYEANRKRNWREMIKAGFPDFDEDLILMLSDKEEDRELLSNAARDAKDSEEDYSLPSNMALEQAARKCGMKPFRLGPRRTRELMNNGTSLKSASGKISLKPPQKVKRGEERISAKRLVSTKIH